MTVDRQPFIFLLVYTPTALTAAADGHAKFVVQGGIATTFFQFCSCTSAC